MATDVSGEAGGAWCGVDDGPSAYRGGGGQLLPRDWSVSVPGSAWEQAQVALGLFEAVADGVAGLDVGDWQGAASAAARSRIGETAMSAGAVVDRLRDALVGLDAQCRAVDQALASAVGIP